MDEKSKITVKDSFSELGEIKKAFTPEQVKFVIETVAPGLNEKEVWLFLLKANTLKLNPLLGEIFAYAYIDRMTRQRRLVVIEGRNGKRNLAAKTGKIESIKTEAIYVKDFGVKTSEVGPDNKPIFDKQTVKVKPWEGGTLWGATCEIKVQGKEALITETVKFSEYNTGKNVWLSKPETMIKKVAESQALSSALPGMMMDLLGEAENYIADQPKIMPAIVGGDKPANDTILKTLKAVGADMTKAYTVQTANEEIVRITREKAQKKKEAKKSEELKPVEGKLYLER